MIVDMTDIMLLCEWRPNPGTVVRGGGSWEGTASRTSREWATV